MLFPMNLPIYPEWTKLELNHQRDIKSLLKTLSDGISEYTFAGLFLFRNNYTYRISLTPSFCEERKGQLMVSGTQRNSEGEEETFVMLPQGFPGIRLVDELLEQFCGIKNLSEHEAETHRIEIERRGYCVLQDRDNFDYIYTRKDLAELSGKKFHKKRNLVNGFVNNYSYEEKRITGSNRCDLYTILEVWKSEREDPADYASAKEAIDLIEELNLRGCITYVDGKPSAFSMGEVFNQGSMFALHFEKAIGSYRGIYQFINQSFASMMDESILYINREQDLGDQGLRQAKMSYRPTGFVKKYRICSSSFSPCEELEELT